MKIEILFSSFALIISILTYISIRTNHNKFSLIKANELFYQDNKFKYALVNSSKKHIFISDFRLIIKSNKSIHIYPQTNEIESINSKVIEGNKVIPFKAIFKDINNIKIDLSKFEYNVEEEKYFIPVHLSLNWIDWNGKLKHKEVKLYTNYYNSEGEYKGCKIDKKPLVLELDNQINFNLFS